MTAVPVVVVVVVAVVTNVAARAVTAVVVVVGDAASVATEPLLLLFLPMFLFRPKYNKIYMIREAFSQSHYGLPKVVVASATLPETMRREIVEIHRVRQDRAVTTRMKPARTNIFIRVKPAAKAGVEPFSGPTIQNPRRNSIVRELTPIIRDLKSDSYEKTIIFFNQKWLCGEVHELIELQHGLVTDESVVQIHADLGRELKELTFAKVISGKVKLILATESAGTGADFDGFKVTILSLTYYRNLA